MSYICFFAGVPYGRGATKGQAIADAVNNTGDNQHTERGHFRMLDLLEHGHMVTSSGPIMAYLERQKEASPDA